VAVLASLALAAAGAALAGPKPHPGRTAVVKGHVRLCGGPPPGRCWVGSIGECDEGVGCATTDRVAFVDADGKRVGQARLHHGRFGTRVRPGTYTVKLLEDGKAAHGKVVQKQSVTAVAHQTKTVEFFFAVP
jgi:hypothetical protein